MRLPDSCPVVAVRVLNLDSSIRTTLLYAATPAPGDEIETSDGTFIVCKRRFISAVRWEKERCEVMVWVERVPS